MNTARSLLMSAMLAAAVLSLMGCGPTRARARRLRRAARPMDCRDFRGVPVHCPEDWP